MSAMSDPMMINVRNPRSFDLAVYLTLTIMATIGLIVLPNTGERALAIALCVVFGIVYRIGNDAISTPRRAYGYFAIQTLLISGLLTLSTISDVFGFLF